MANSKFEIRNSKSLRHPRLEELLNRPHPGEHDVDVVKRLEPEESDHVVNIANWIWLTVGLFT